MLQDKSNVFHLHILSICDFYYTKFQRLNKFKIQRIFSGTEIDNKKKRGKLDLKIHFLATLIIVSIPALLFSGFKN